MKLRPPVNSFFGPRALALASSGCIFASFQFVQPNFGVSVSQAWKTSPLPTVVLSAHDGVFTRGPNEKSPAILFEILSRRRALARSLICAASAPTPGGLGGGGGWGGTTDGCDAAGKRRLSRRLDASESHPLRLRPLTVWRCFQGLVQLPSSS